MRRLCLTAAIVASLTLPASAGALQQKLTSEDGESSDWFGSAASVDGDTIVIGAPGNDGKRGAIYVFRRLGDTWTSVAKLTASDAQFGDFLGQSVAIDGNAIVAGAPGDDNGGGAFEGSVYTFARDGSVARNETAKLTASSGVAGDSLGNSVAIDGDMIVAGAPNDNGAFNDQGAVFTFARSGPPERTETAKLAASDRQASDLLGRSVAIDGETIVAGSYSDAGGVMNRGAVYTFARTGPAAREETAKLMASDAAKGDFLGGSVAIEGDTIVGGAPQDDGGALNLGAVYTFASTGAAARTETAKLTASAGVEDDLLGYRVAIDDGSIVASARTDEDRGAIYSFSRTGSSRSELSSLTAPDGAPNDYLGESLAVDGETIVAGAFYDDFEPVINQGSAYVFFAPVPDAADTAAPNTKLRGPKRVERGRKAKFRFESSEPGSTFFCKLDRKEFRRCASPRKVRTGKLATGRRHRFKVKAIDAAGNADPTPARLRFRVRS